MKRTLLMLVICLLTLSIFARAETAEEMVSYCKPVAEAKVTTSGVAFPDDATSGICWGAFMSFSHVIHVVDISKVNADGKYYQTLFGVCPPGGSDEIQYIKVFLAYADRHPELLHIDYWKIAMDANKEAFPCRP